MVVAWKDVQPVDAVPGMPDAIVVQDRLARLARSHSSCESFPIDDHPGVRSASNCDVTLRNGDLELDRSSVDAYYDSGRDNRSSERGRCQVVERDVRPDGRIRLLKEAGDGGDSGLFAQSYHLRRGKNGHIPGPKRQRCRKLIGGETDVCVCADLDHGNSLRLGGNVLHRGSQ